MPLVNGFSSHIPRDVVENTPTLGGFPSRGFKILRRDRVRYAVFTPYAWIRIRSRITGCEAAKCDPYLRRRYADDRVWLYEIVGFPE